MLVMYLKGRVLLYNLFLFFVDHEILQKDGSDLMLV